MGAPVLPAPESGLTTSRWTFTRGGALSLRLGVAPGTPWQRLASSYQCGPVSGAALTLTFVGSRAGESVSLPLDGRRANEFITYYPECPGGEDGWGPFHIVGYAHETIPLGAVEAGDAVDVHYVAGGLTVPLRAPATVDSTMAVSPGGVLEVTGEAWMPVGDLYVSFDTFYGRLAETLDLAAYPDTLTEAGEEAWVLLETPGIPADSAVTFSVVSTLRGGLRRDDGSSGPGVPSLTVPASEAESGVRFVAASPLPPEAGVVDVTATALGREGAVRLTLGAGPPPVTLSVTASADTLNAGEETGFTVDAPGLDPSTPVTFSVPDLSLGGFTGGPALRAQTQTAVTTTLAGVSSIRFRAVDEAPAEAASVTVIASAGGHSASTALTLLPAAELFLLRQNNSRETSGVVMVSRFPTNDRMAGGNTFGGLHPNATEVLDHRLLPMPASDRFTVRPAINNAFALGPLSGQTGVDCGDVRFRLRVYRNGTPIGFRAGDGWTADAAAEAFYEYRAVGATAAATGECRADRYIRFVSNAPPGHGGSPGTANPQGGGTYDDQYEGSQTVRVQLGDVVRVSVAVGSTELSPHNEYIVGNIAGALSDPLTPADVFVRWATIPGSSAAPGAVTDRVSEDLAQAAVRLRLRSASPYQEIQNVIGLFPPNGANPRTWTPSSADIVGVRVVLPGLNGGPNVTVNGQYAYAVGESMEVIASRLLGDLAANSNGRIDVGVNSIAGLVHPSGGPNSGVDPAMTILVGRGQSLVNVTSTGSGPIIVGRFGVRYNKITSMMHQVVAANAEDGDPSTLDIIEVRNNSLYGDAAGTVGLSGSSFGYGSSSQYPDFWANTVLIDAYAADAPDNLPHVAGHEVAHVLLNETYPGAAVGDPTCRQPDQHDPDATNLVACAASAPTEGYGTQKRLTHAQILDIRADHEPTGGPADRARLLRPFNAPMRLAATP